MSRCDAHAT